MIIKTWSQLKDPVDISENKLIATYNFDAVSDNQIYDLKPIHKEDIVDAMAYSQSFLDTIRKSFEMMRNDDFKKHFEYPLTPKSIEQSADHKTVVVIWQDKSKTIVNLSENDRDDINTAFAYALAKKIFGSNTHLKKVVKEHLNEHKPRKKTSSNEYGGD